MMIRRARLTLLAALAALFVLIAESRPAVNAQTSPAPDIARGRHIATALTGCAACHGANFAGGRPFPVGAQTVYAANLTGGAGGIAAYTDADLRRAIRGGVAPDGSPLRVMPSEEYAVMTDADVDDVIAFLRTVPPVDQAVPRAAAPPEPSPSGHAMTSTQAPPALTGGAYLATIGGCLSCHGANLAGGAHFGDVVAPNISRDGIGAWTAADFTTALRTGKTPDGRTLSKYMPWPTFANMTDDELLALYTFLQSMPARAGDKRSG